MFTHVVSLGNMRGISFSLFLICCFLFFPATSVAGDRALISGLSVTGNGEISLKEIKSVISEVVPPGRFSFWKESPEFDSLKVERNIEYLRQFLAGNGYYDSSVVWRAKRGKNNGGVSLKISIRLDRPVLVSEVILDIKGYFQPEYQVEIRKLLDEIPLSSGERFSIQRFKKAKGVVKNALVEMGYAKAHLDSNGEIDRKERRVSVIFTIDPGDTYTFGDIEITESNKALRSLIINNISYKTGDISSPSKVFDSQRRLVGLGYFETVSITSEIDTDSRTVSTVIKTVRRKTMTLQLGAGVGRVDKLRGRVRIINRNFLNLNRTLEVSAKVSFASQVAALIVRQPGFLGKDSNFSLIFDIRRDDFPSYEADFLVFSSELQKRFKDGLFSVYFGPTVIGSKIRSQAIETDFTRGLENIFLVTLAGGFEVVRTGNVIDPSGGFIASFDTELAGAFLGSEREYVKTVFETTGYLDFYGVVFAKKIQVGFIEPFGRSRRQDVPLFARLFAGGSKSMRGFSFQRLGPLDLNEDPLGGNSLITGSVEARFPIRQKLGGVFFLDYGNVFPKSFDYKIDDLRYALGGGLRYKFVGIPIGLDFGYTLNPDPRLRRYQIFLNVGQAF